MANHDGNLYINWKDMKVTKLITIDKDPELSELRGFISKHNHNCSSSYNEVLKQAIEKHLGRPLDFTEDLNRIQAVTVIDSNVTSYFVDNILIGTLTTDWDYNDTDFMDNKVSYRMTFKSA